MNDRLARVLAAVAIGLGAVAVVVSMYALSVVQECSDQLEAITEGVQRALAAQRSTEVPLHGPPPALDPGD